MWANDGLTDYTATPEPPKMTVTTRVRYWPDRLRLAWAAITGRQFSLACYVGDIEVKALAGSGQDG